MAVKLIALVAVGAAIGAGLGATRSCKDGGCPLTANPKRGAMWGGFLGLMMAVAVGPLGPVAARDAGPVPEAVVQVTSYEAFEENVSTFEGTSMVLFHADWCGACQQFKPTFYDVAKERGADVRFVSIDTDDVGDVARDLGIRALPTTVVFRYGEEQQRFIGAVDRGRLTQALDAQNGQEN